MPIYLSAHQGLQSAEQRKKITRKELEVLFPEVPVSWHDKLRRAIRINKEMDAEFRRIVR